MNATSTDIVPENRYIGPVYAPSVAGPGQSRWFHLGACTMDDLSGSLLRAVVALLTLSGALHRLGAVSMPPLPST